MYIYILYIYIYNIYIYIILQNSQENICVGGISYSIKFQPGVQSFYKIDILKNFAKFTRKHLCWSLFFK